MLTMVDGGMHLPCLCYSYYYMYREDFEAANAMKMDAYQTQLADWKAYERERVILSTHTYTHTHTMLTYSRIFLPCCANTMYVHVSLCLYRGVLAVRPENWNQLAQLPWLRMDHKWVWMQGRS